MSEEKAYDKVTSLWEEEETYDTYSPIFQPIMPDEFRSADEKLDDVIRKMVNETIGDVPIYQAKQKNSKAGSWTDPKNKSKKKKFSFGGNSAGGNKNKEPGKLNGTQIAGLVFACIAVVIALVYLYFAYSYKEVFFDGTFINGVDVGGMTPEQVEADIAAQVEDYDVTITFRGGSNHEISGDQFDFHYVSNNKAREIKDAQPFMAWIQGKIGHTEKYTIEEATAYDRDKLKNLVLDFDELKEENQVKPTNAFLQINEGDSFIITPETEGNTIIQDKFFDKLYNAIDLVETEVNFSKDNDVYETATIKADNPELNTQMADLNAFLDTTVTYNMYDGMQQIVDRHTLIQWLDVNEDGFYFINTDKINQKAAEFVSNMAQTFDFVKKTRTFNSTQRGPVELGCSEYGIIIDQQQETEALLNDVLNRITDTREPIYSRNDGVKSANFDGTYIEVDIDNQHLYLYKEGQLVVDSACVTGLNEGDRKTPKGVWKIYSKQRDRVLRGEEIEEGVYSYEAHVNY
ncbi:MAG: peptidoglycan binding domain-containing protein [Lachnospiraceae bacterium]|nr:peptidoglycan binding domain-containing protein [Candidatus Equihabitans merdae]